MGEANVSLPYLIIQLFSRGQPKMKHFGFLALILVLPFLGCSPGQRMREIHWDSRHQSGLTAELATIVSAPKKDQYLSTSVFGQKVEHWQPTTGGFPIADSWVKVIRDARGGPQFIRAQVSEFEPSREDLDRARQLESRKQIILDKAWKSFAELRTAKKIFPARVILKQKMLRFEPQLEIVFFTQDDTDVVQLTLSGRGKLIERRSIAQHLTRGSGMVFLGVPERSNLTEVEFSDLVGDGTLNSSVLKVESEIANRAFSPTHEFRFSPTDKPFDEVQAYYYVERSLAWLKKEFGVTLPFQLGIKVHVGGLKPSNAAFYYKGNIRLGDGDNVTYRNIPRDPTVVVHEAAHAVVEVLAGLPQDKEGGSLNEGYADFIAALFLDNPRMAEYSYLKGPFRRSLENDLVAGRDFKGGLYHDATIVGGTLWDLRNALGTQVAGKVAIGSLSKLGAGSQFKDFAPAIVSACENLGLDSTQTELLQSVLKKRGWL